MTDTLLPWHKPQWDSLQARQTTGTLPHALLLCGPNGVGKLIFAEHFAKALLCNAADRHARPCGICKQCILFAAGSHPDLHVVQPESIYNKSDTLLAKYSLRYPVEGKSKDSKDSTAMRIDQIRALIAGNQTRPQLAANKVIILNPADTLNKNAANSLLKTLEEPTPDSVLILVTDRPASLPATVRSRCQRVLFHKPPAIQARAWLQPQIPVGQDLEALLAVAEGAPLRALALAQGDALQRRQTLFSDLAQVACAAADPLAVAAGWLKSDIKETLDWLRTGVMDMIRLKTVGQSRLVNRDLGKELQRLADGLDLQALYGHLDRLTQAASLADTSINNQLLLEDILIPWTVTRQAH